MNRQSVITSCKDCERATLAQAMQEWPGMIYRKSGRYISVLTPNGYNPAFGDYKWDMSWDMLSRVIDRAERAGGLPVTISGVLTVANEWHHFDINKHLAVYDWHFSIPVQSFTK